MSASIIKQAQDKGLRHQFSNAYGAVRAFSSGLYAAHGGWHPATRASRAGQQRNSGIVRAGARG